jgi:hypothetical protein
MIVIGGREIEKRVGGVTRQYEATSIVAITSLRICK